MTNIEQIINLFKQRPYLIRMGAGKISKAFPYSPEEIRKARSSFRSNKPLNPNHPKILIFDIETSPLRAFVWSRWKQNIYLDQTIAEWFMICWSAKWLGEDTVYSDVLTSQEILKENDTRITQSIWALLDEADIVIAHNGKRFDVPKLNSRFILNGFPPPAPYKQIDTKEVSAKEFGFSSNKLDALAGYFNIEHKDDTDFNLWVKCLEGDQESLDYMVTYNKKDVTILEKIYLRLRPWIKNHPNVAVYIESDNKVCPYCGSEHIYETVDYVYTQVNKYRAFRCEVCKGIARMRTTSYPVSKKKNLITSI